MDKALLIGLARHVLQLGAGALVARGYIAENMAEQVIGALVTLGTAASYVIGRVRSK
jgi:hypothetical protein